MPLRRILRFDHLIDDATGLHPADVDVEIDDVPFRMGIDGALLGLENGCCIPLVSTR